MAGKDNGVAVVTTHCFGSEPKMASKGKKRNSCTLGGMGGIDSQDQKLNKYRISMHTKKTWWRLFSWVTDVTIPNV